MENEIILYTQKESKDFLWAGFQKIHKVLNIAQMPSEYYLEINKMFNGRTREYFMLVVSKMVVDFRSYQMPTRKDFRGFMKDINHTTATPIAIEQRIGPTADRLQEFHRLSMELKRKCKL